MNLQGNVLGGSEMDRTGSRFGSVLDFGISVVEPSDSITRNWAS
jgi:hypothetical protein